MPLTPSFIYFRYTLECMKGSHECKECDERGARRSTTFFGKVRLNITSLQIIGKGRGSLEFCVMTNFHKQ